MYSGKQLPYLCLLKLLALVLWTGEATFAQQCPTLKAVMVDPCGNDVRNEFIILDSGTGFNTGDLQISFDANANGSGQQNNDINININNDPNDTRPCRFQPGNAALITGCPNVRIVSQDENIPRDAIVIIQMSGNADEVYDFSYLCGNGECVYVLQNDCIRTKEAFGNKGSGTWNTLIALSNTQCRNDYTYNRSSLTSGNGDFYAPQGTSTYGNRGCGVTPPVSGSTIPPEFVNPGDLFGCGEFVLPSISGLNITGGERYYTGPFGSGISYTSGDIITRSTNLFIFDETAPCSPEELFRVIILDPVTPSLAVPDPLCAQDTPYPLDVMQDGIAGTWSGDGVVNNLFTPDVLNGGTYTLTFTPDSSECANPNTIDVEVLPTPVAGINLQFAYCDGSGANLGIFDLTQFAETVNGGTNDQVLWYEDAALTNLIEDSTSFTSPPTEIYALIDNGVCLSDPAPVQLLVGNPPTISFSIGVLSCAGDTNGTIDISVSGGNPPYTTEWSDPAYNGQTSLSNLGAGTYIVTVTDSDGCSKSQLINIIDPPALSLQCDKIQDIGTVVGKDGQASFTVSGGIGPYWVVWDGPETDSAQILTPNGTLTVDTLAAGTYDVRVRDALGCLAFCQVEIESPNCDLTISSVSTPPTCFDSSDGSISLTATGGQGLLTYTWNVNSLNGMSTPQNLSAGQYEVSVTDEIGCREILSFTLNAPPVIDLSCMVTEPVSTFGANDGRADIQVSGGTPPYRISWTGPQSGDQSLNAAGSISLDDLTAGTFEVSVLDANNCRQICNFTVPEGNCDIELTTTVVDESCAGESDGSLQLNLSGNWIAPITYDWDNDSYDGLDQLSGISAGTYSVTVSGANGCQAVNSVTVGTQFSLPEVSFISEATICQGACYTFELNFSGTGPFSADFILKLANQDIPLSIDTDQNVESLTICPSDYEVNSGSLQLILQLVSDAHCTNGQTQESTLTVLQPSASYLTPTLCPGENITVNGEIYDINRPSGTEILSGGNQFGCDSIININLNFDPENTLEITDTLCPGESITVNGEIYDENRPEGTQLIPATGNCDSLIIITLQFFQPATGRLDTTLCPGEELLINGNTYNEQNPSGSELFPGASRNGCDSTLEISLTYFPEASGDYTATLCPDESVTINGSVYDRDRPTGTEILPGMAANGCDSVVYIALNFLPAPVTVLRDTLCPDGSLIVNGTTYDQSRPTGTEIFPNSGQNGCDSLVQIELVFQEDVTVSIIGDQEICSGEEAVLEFRISNALTPIDIRYTVDGGADTWIYGVVDGDLLPVSPNVTTTYAIVEALVPPNFCTVSIGSSATVAVSSLMVDAMIVTDYFGYGVSCTNGQDGAIGAYVMSGEGPFEYVWQDGVRLPERTNLSAGVYSVVVTDAYGCSAEALVNLEAPPPLDMQLSVLSPDCRGGQSGAIIIDTISGGNPAYYYSLNGGPVQNIDQLPHTIPGLPTGRHRVEIGDEFGCTRTKEVVITDFIPLELVVVDDQEIRNGETVRLDAVTNFEIDSLIWTPSDHLSSPNSLPTYATPDTTTTYQLEVFDSRGCSVTAWVTIKVNREDDIYLPNAFTPNNDGINDRIYPFTNPNIQEILEFRVFNRWGNQMHFREHFPGNKEAYGWDGIFNGQPMNAAVFIYFVRFRYLNGDEGVIKGDFVLVR